MAESTEQSAGNVTFGLFGNQFFGHARVCPDCKSYVTTLWRCVLNFPVTPLGTFRYLDGGVTFGGAKFGSRRMPLDADQVREGRRTGYLIAAIAVIVVGGIILYKTLG